MIHWKLSVIFLEIFLLNLGPSHVHVTHMENVPRAPILGDPAISLLSLDCLYVSRRQENCISKLLLRPKRQVSIPTYKI